MLDRIRCPSCFFYTVSTETGSPSMCGGLSRRSYGREELCRCGAVPAKTLTYILGAKAAFPFRRRAAPWSRAGVATGPAGPAPGWPCLWRRRGRFPVRRPRGAEARASSGRAPSGPGKRRVCPPSPAVKPGFAPRLLNTSQKMRLCPSGAVAACLPRLWESGVGRAQDTARAYYPRFKSRALIVENVQFVIFLSKQNTAPAQLRAAMARNEQGRDLPDVRLRGMKLQGLTEAPSHCARPKPRLFSGNAVSGSRKRLSAPTPARRRSSVF